MYICMNVCVCMYVCLRVSVCDLSVCACFNMCVCECVWMPSVKCYRRIEREKRLSSACVRMYACVCACVNASLLFRLHVCLSLLARVNGR